MATKITFEDKMKKLDEIVSKMNSEDIKLDEMLSLYKKANNLIKDLRKEIDDAKSKIEEL